jgi:hypothetical protein
VAPGRVTFDVAVPPGMRFYTVHSANQPAFILLRDFRVPVLGDFLLAVRPSPQNPAQVVLILAGP